MNHIMEAVELGMMAAEVAATAAAAIPFGSYAVPVKAAAGHTTDVVKKISEKVGLTNLLKKMKGKVGSKKTDIWNVFEYGKGRPIWERGKQSFKDTFKNERAMLNNFNKGSLTWLDRGKKKVDPEDLPVGAGPGHGEMVTDLGMDAIAGVTDNAELIGKKLTAEES